MKLLIRRINEADLLMIMEWRTNPEVSKYMYTDFVPDMEKQRQWFDTINSDPTQKCWIINLDSEDVGLVSITKIDLTNKRCVWAYYLGSPSVRGKGIGKNIELNILDYVFNTLKLNKLCCEVYVANDIVIKIHEKYGSIVEGTRRQQVFKNDQFHDIVEMGILREDWVNNIRGEFEYTVAVFE